MQNKNLRKSMSISVTSEQEAFIREICETDARYPSQVIRRIIDKYMEDYDYHLGKLQ
jgi:predicted DNA-binding protein